MDKPHDIPLRIARNRLLDLLGIGDSYPLTDLDVIADQIKVPHGDPARIPIDRAQAGVTYRLCDPGGTPLRAKIKEDEKLTAEERLKAEDKYKVEGNDIRAEIVSPPVGADITYRILATKNSWEPALGQLYLEEGARVRVGLNTGLELKILPEKTPLLDPAVGSPLASDPRIVPYGTSVTVEIAKTQEAVKYSLVLNDKVALNDKGVEVSDTGNLHEVTLQTGPLYEDTLIQVRAAKDFPTMPDRAPDTDTLNAKLYVKVMANPALKVAVDPSPIIDYGQGAKIKIAGTQKSAKYWLDVRPIPDPDFVHGPAAGARIESVAVPGKPDAQIRKPPRSVAWSLPEGYVQARDAVPGTDGDLILPIKPLADDVLVIVQALKEHRVDAGDPKSRIIASAVDLEQAAVVLVRPDPARALKLRVPVSDKQTGETMEVSGGQPGVYYYFRPAGADKEFPLAAYFHKRDDKDTQNKGVGQLAIEVDLAIATDPDARGVDVAATDLAATAPRFPLVGIAKLAAGSSLSVRAVKAQSAVETAMAQDALIAAVPAISAEPSAIDLGTSAKIVIPASDPKDQYQVMLKGVPVKPAVAGDKSDLAVVTDPLQADAVFEVVVTPSADKGMQVTRVVQVPVFMRPDTTLAVAPRLDAVDKDTGTDIVVQKSQPNVAYQLMSGKTVIGPAVPGTGAQIVLPTGPIPADTTFTVAAARAGNAQIAAVLKAQATVKLIPPPPPPAPTPDPAASPAAPAAPDAAASPAAASPAAASPAATSPAAASPAAASPAAAAPDPAAAPAPTPTDPTPT